MGSSAPSIAIAGKNVYVVWHDDSPGNFEILYRRSTDGGATFGSTVNLSNDPAGSALPAIAVSGSNVYVVWLDGSSTDVLFRRSTDGGATFGSTVNLSNNPAGSHQPTIAASANNVYVVWLDQSLGNTETFYRRSTDGGATFESTINLSNNIGSSDLASIAVSGNNVHVVWDDDSAHGTDNPEILYRRSIDGGATFGSVINLSNNAGLSFFPSIAVSSNNVYVVWSDESAGDLEIFHRLSTDGGVSFGSTTNLSNNEGSSFTPSIAVLGNNVYIIWVEMNSLVDFEILLITSTDGGSNFGRTAEFISNSGQLFVGPAIAVSGNDV